MCRDVERRHQHHLVVTNNRHQNRYVVLARQTLQCRINIHQVSKFATHQGYEETSFLCHESI